MKTTGHKILITGATKGIGRALTHRFLQLGNVVIAVGRSTRDLDELQKQFPQVIPYSCDLSHHGAMEQLVTYVENEHADINVVINNAGIQYNYDLLSEENVSDRIAYETQVNLLSPMRLTAMLLPILVLNREPAVINISSALGFVPKNNAVVYSATKAAIHAFSVALRHQQPALKVFEIIPSLVNTAMTAGRGKNKISPEELVDAFLSAFQRDKYEINIGKVGLLRMIHGILPSLAHKIINQ